jgi:hypothetical protein
MSTNYQTENSQLRVKLCSWLGGNCPWSTGSLYELASLLEDCDTFTIINRTSLTLKFPGPGSGLFTAYPAFTEHVPKWTENLASQTTALDMPNLM